MYDLNGISDGTALSNDSDPSGDRVVLNINSGVQDETIRIFYIRN